MIRSTGAFPVIDRIWIFAVLLLVCFGAAGCSQVKSILPKDKDAKLLFKSRDQYVRIVKQDAVKGMTVPANEHPVSLDMGQIRNVLSSLEIMLPKQDKSVPVFAKPELDNLERYLSQGLAEAGPGEDVIFAVVGDFRAAYGLAKVPKYTTGRVFYREGKLNIIFGKIQEDYKSYDLYAPVDRRTNPLSPGSRSVPSEHAWTLLDQPDQSFNMTNAGERTDWVILDLASMEARAALGEKDAEAQSPTRPGAQPSSGPQKSLEERLQILNDLKNKKLITEEEYQQKRLEMLKDL
ncbi:MAG: hypothetical protein EG828_05795 [Deltaproteobacteria bacterium]|nr:hypothetical protein [Deltaproteobacteria bacterium]